ncbi:MAG: TonB-dependent receptor [Fidelibacterota bacterium]|nr:MAG: TonB-dependent receptor [Candidatus Neomarinimicrobiota bacterium]
MIRATRMPKVRVLTLTPDSRTRLVPWLWLWILTILVWPLSLPAQMEVPGGYEATGLLAGFVLDGETGEGLPGANVFLEGTNYGAATNIDGYFVLTRIPAGSYTLRVGYLGYENVQVAITVEPDQELRRNVELMPQAVELEAVEVSAERIERQVNNQISRVQLGARALKNVPQVGEADLLRTLQALPGVLTPAEFSTGLIIRGGNTDQNLILLDGITVYNPSHLGGLFSNFILDAIKEADLSKGGFNAEYGGRLSAVLNVTSREGNRNEFDAKASVSLLSAQTTLEGPLGKGAWLLSGRRTYFDQIFKGTDLYFPYYFYDLQGHVFQDLTPQDRIAVSWYRGRDELQLSDFLLAASWGNQTVSTTYRKLLNPQVVTNWMLASSRFDTRFNLGGDTGLGSKNIIKDVTLRSDWAIFASQSTQLRLGGEVKDLAFKYNQSFLDTLFSVGQAPLEAALYAKVKRWITPRLMVEPGLRLTYYSQHSRNWYGDPRLGFKFLLTSDRYINGAVGVYHQFMQTSQDDFNPSILDQWFAVDGSVNPGRAVQVVLGYEEYIGNRYRFQVEAYAKSLENMLTFVDQRATTDQQVRSDNLDDLFDVSSGYAYGVEFFLQKTTGRLNGWLSYTYSTVRKQFQGEEYYANWDRRHALNVISNFKLSKKWELNASWTYQSGQPYTPILGYYAEQLPNEPEAFYRPIPGGRNSSRYPPYHRLDLGAVYHRETRWGGIDLFFQVVNAYYRKNVFRYLYQFGSTNNNLDDDGDGRIDETDEGLPRRQPISIFPILPSLGVTIEF